MHGARRRPDRRAPGCPGSAPRTTCRTGCRARPTRSSRRATRSAGRGICSATRACGRTRTCTRSATGSGRGSTSKAIADGPSILDYVRDTAREAGIDQRRALRPPRPRAPRGRPRTPAGRSRPRAGRRSRATSSTSAAATTATTRATCRSSPDVERSPGRIVHPQFWPEDLDYAGKRVVVIGSGATAVTLVPALAERGRARDDAPALADVHPLDPVGGRDRQRAAAAARRPPRVRDHALEERRASRRSIYQLSQRRPRLMRALLRARRGARAAGRLRRRHPLQPALRPVGPAAVPGARRRPVQGDLARPGVDGHRHDRALHAERAAGWRPGGSSRPTSSSPRPG